MSGKVIGTHSGPFHGDEVMACAILKLHPDYRDGEVVRSREKETLDKCDIVVDVGGRFSHEERRYDHHQREFHLTMDQLSDGEINKETKLSSAGLVFYYYGKEVIRDTLHRLELAGEKDIIKIDWIWKRIYFGLIKEIDAIDNGLQRQLPGSNLIKTGYSSKVGRLNPSWEEENPDFNKSFNKALELATGELIDILKDQESVFKAKMVVSLILNVLEMKKHHKSGRVLILPDYVPWSSVLTEVEREAGMEGHILFVVSPSPESGGFHLKAVHERIKLLDEWGALEGEELQRVTGVKGAKFVHGNLHLAVTDTVEAAISLVDLVLDKRTQLSRNLTLDSIRQEMERISVDDRQREEREEEIAGGGAWRERERARAESGGGRDTEGERSDRDLDSRKYGRPSGRV